jgi:SAM-dependent methyltransferase
VGILAEPAQFVRELKLPKKFSICELGDQWVTYLKPHVLAEEFFRTMGCGKYVSIDANGKGTLSADLNRPLPAMGQFDLVTDFGTGEHIFNQAQVWRTVHELTKPSGYIAFDRPSQGYEGHCFYNTHETLFRDIAAANEYEIVRLERGFTTRGELIRGVFRKGPERKFQTPQQGRYLKSLKI